MHAFNNLTVKSKLYLLSLIEYMQAQILIKSTIEDVHQERNWLEGDKGHPLLL